MKSYSLFIVVVCAYSVYAAGPECGANFDRNIKDSTNSYRNKNNVNSVIEDRSLIESAQDRAYYLCDNDEFEHSDTDGVGENLYKYSTTSSSTPADLAGKATKSWYSECQCYNGENTANAEYGHFTQLVWKNTTRMGCGCCGYVSGSWYNYVVVCQYKPPGNYEGEYRKNVIAPYCNAPVDKLRC